ncbi:hypothetical protein ACXR2W_08030 [Leucobacter sp. HY1908]
MDNAPVVHSRSEAHDSDEGEALPIRGRTQITSSALHSIVAGAAATQLAVPTGTVTVRITDADGDLGIRVSAPICVAALASTAVSSALPGETLTQRSERLRLAIGRQITELTGHRVGSLALHLTTARIAQKGRAR